ncbi:hypothetical protein J2S41_004157 [Catenuloplanes atrovinosus]|uniref:Uncharacterized protein n=1 Tax=Catenuloplanes atrovinosus TaxID=137266 RepID=A0AAE4CBX1_9ACTN|nr:hypothetical protein [Catenuloplanes atrovinosus]
MQARPGGVRTGASGASSRNALPWKTSGGTARPYSTRRTASSAITWSPAGTSSAGAQSNQAAAPPMRTAPDGAAVQSTPANRSTGPASRRLSGPCPAASTLTPIPRERRSSGQVRESRRIETASSGGSSETGTNELTAIPSGAPSTSADSAVTPLGKRAKAARSAVGST